MAWRDKIEGVSLINLHFHKECTVQFTMNQGTTLDLPTYNFQNFMFFDEP